MSAFLANLGVLIFFLVIIFWIVSLIKPKLFSKYLKDKSDRKNLSAISAIVLLSSVVIIGAFGVEAEQTAKTNDTEMIQTTSDNESVIDSEQAKTEYISKPEIKQSVTSDRDYWHEVISVVDGDTVKARVDGKIESVRIIGIDSPEATSTTECFGDEATKNAKNLLENKWIQLEKDDSQSNRDKYDRLLRFIWMDNGTDFGLQMIKEGYAHEYTYSVAYKYQSEYKDAEKYAEDNNKGLWSPDTCDGKDQKPTSTTTPTPTPTPTPVPSTPPASKCDPNYTPCVPLVSYDLDCPDIGFMVKVIGSDPHRFDGNHDGWGCESYN